MSKHHITLLPHGGLCNRITAICSALQLARLTDSSLRIVWEKDSGLNCRYDRLFLPIDKPNVEMVEATLMDKLRWGRPRKTNLWLTKIPQAMEFDAVSDEHITLKRERARFDFVKWIEPYDKVYISACNHFCKAEDYDFLQLQVSPDIEARVRHRFAPLANHKAAIGMHIRRTDHTVAIAGSPTEGFIEKIDAQLQKEPDTIFYLATDSEEEKANLKARYGERIFCSAQEADRNSEEGIVEAMVELYTLASCQEVWRSVNSSFSHVAAVISQKRQETL